MTDTRAPLTLETALYAALFGGALALRLLHLGQAPLSDVEAREALAVLDWLRGAPAAGPLPASPLPASPAYFFLTYLAFWLFGASDAAARLGPALLGSALVLAPALVRDRLGRGGALAASAVLAISSSLLAASRSADGAVIALFALAFGLGGLWRYIRSGSAAWAVAAGAALGLGLASGPAFLLGLVSLGLALLLLDWSAPEGEPGPRETLVQLRAGLPLVLAAAGLAVLLVSTVLLVYLPGVGALAASWLAWLRGYWPATAGRPAALVPLFVLVYEPLLVVFGLAGAWRAFRAGNRLGMGLAWFSLLSVAQLLLYSGRQLPHVVWITAPLAVLAGWALHGIIADRWSRSDAPVAVVQAGITLAVTAFAFLNVASYAEMVRAGRAGFPLYQTTIMGVDISVTPIAPLGVALLALALVFVVAYLLGMGWAPRGVQLGLAAAGGLVLLAMNTSAAVGLTLVRPHSPVELWAEQPAAADVRRLQATLADVSNFWVGLPTDIQVAVQASEQSALAWALRDYGNAVFVDRLAPAIDSPVVITPHDVQDPTLGSVYVGQSFPLRATWQARMSLPEWVNWLAYRRAARVETEPVILWVRQDVQQLRTSGN
jgi:4-amino-4-deoxy-L-arabinose transferase-like glycosyltransferase